jgi:hypothetical protein
MRRQTIRIDDFVEITISSRKTSKQRRIDELVGLLAETDTLIVTELSRLGRSTAEVIALVNALVLRNIRLITIKQNLDITNQDMNARIIITLFSLFGELVCGRKKPWRRKRRVAIYSANLRALYSKAKSTVAWNKSRNCLDMACLFGKLPKCWVVRVTSL